MLHVLFMFKETISLRPYMEHGKKKFCSSSCFMKTTYISEETPSFSTLEEKLLFEKLFFTLGKDPCIISKLLGGMKSCAMINQILETLDQSKEIPKKQRLIWKNDVSKRKQKKHQSKLVFASNNI